VSHANGAGEPACLFQFNDEPVLRALGLFQEETARASP
jgi:gentisate 1,2-dioxygenase